MNPEDLIIIDKTLKYFLIKIVQPRKYLNQREGKLVFRSDFPDDITR